MTSISRLFEPTTCGECDYFICWGGATGRCTLTILRNERNEAHCMSVMKRGLKCTRFKEKR